MRKNSFSISNVATALGEFNRLASLVDPANGAGRWEALQGWLDENPKYREILEAYLYMTPGEAADALTLHISNEYNVPLTLLSTFDREGKVRQSAITTIDRIQRLYKERENAK